MELVQALKRELHEEINELRKEINRLRQEICNQS